MTRILLPGLLTLRHIVDLGEPARYQGCVWYPATRLCDGETTQAALPFLDDQSLSVDFADLSDPLVCPTCLAAHQPAPVVDESMGTIPLFDL